ncbi:ester cyclase [Paenibacillus amylolyticus]|uniref:ester cyclase n=2 Tax=Paenibacillus TaxID=44249 RepID=UPI00344D58C8
MVPVGFPPTQKKIEVNAMNFYRISNGQISEEYGQPDMLGLLQFQKHRNRPYSNFSRIYGRFVRISEGALLIV